jgi:serine/threonine-protein kinase RsbW
VHRWVLSSYTELRVLRARLREALASEPLPEGHELDEVPERMAMVASELATNALAHTSPPTVVELRRTESTFILDVADNDPTAFPEFPANRPPGAGGLGLRLVQRVARDIGWYVNDDTKHVWAQLVLPRRQPSPEIIPLSTID